jgi:hypothetical protein
LDLNISIAFSSKFSDCCSVCCNLPWNSSIKFLSSILGYMISFTLLLNFADILLIFPFS